MGDYTEHDVAALAAVLGAAAADGIRHGSFTLARRILDTFQWPCAGPPTTDTMVPGGGDTTVMYDNVIDRLAMVTWSPARDDRRGRSTEQAYQAHHAQMALFGDTIRRIGRFEGHLQAAASAGDEPRFVIRGKDKFAPATVLFHRGKCVEHGLAEQAAQERLAVDEIVAWQVRNPDLVQYPDHTHVPAGSPVDDGGPPATGVGHPTQDVDRPGPGPVDNPGPSVGEVGHPGGQL